MLDTDKKDETNLINALKLNAFDNEPSIVVINKSGQVTGSFKSDTEVSEITVAANKVVKSGCAPGACGGAAKCGPAK